MKDRVVHSFETDHGASCTLDAELAQPEAHHEHGSSCCDDHHHPQRARHERSSILGSILPILACALCPAHVGVWAQATSMVGVGLVITETQHHVLLAVAIAAALALCLYRFVRTRIVGPFVLTIAGCAAFAGSHLFAEENHLASWLSMAVILVASLWQRHAERAAMRLDRRPPPGVAFDRMQNEVE